MENLVAKSSRKFLNYEDFLGGKSYYLLPFKFHRINSGREVLVNCLGDILFVDSSTSERIILKQIDKILEFDLFADLVANFFISEQQNPPLIDVMATKYRTKKAFLDNFTSLHIFVITLRCEHTCHYCQVSRVSENKDAFDMRYDHIDRGIELMMQSPNPHITMEFQGGESLLAFEKIKYAVERAKNEASIYNKQIRFVICSNLATITEEILYYCLDNNILISTSLDGPDFIHNKNRHKKNNDSYRLAVDGIKLSRQVLGEDSISALLTTSKLSLDYPIEIVNEYLNQGFDSIFLRPISPFGFATHNEGKNHYDTTHFLRFYKKAFERILEINMSGIHFREDYATIILKKILTPFPVGYVDLQSPAGLINNVIVFNYDGKVYASDESRMLAEMNHNFFELGDLDTSSYNEIFYGEKAKSIAEYWSNESLPGCSECALQSFCGADPVLNFATQGDPIGYRPSSSFCQKNMEIIRYLLEMMDSNAQVRKIFNSWVN